MVRVYNGIMSRRGSLSFVPDTSAHAKTIEGHYASPALTPEELSILVRNELPTDSSVEAVRPIIEMCRKLENGESLNPEEVDIIGLKFAVEVFANRFQEELSFDDPDSVVQNLSSPFDALSRANVTTVGEFRTRKDGPIMGIGPDGYQKICKILSIGLGMAVDEFPIYKKPTRDNI